MRFIVSLLCSGILLSACSTTSDAPRGFDQKMEPTMGIEEFDNQAKTVIDSLDLDSVPQDIEIEVNNQ